MSEPTTNNKKLIVFLDAIGRTIIGHNANETNETISIENPALVHVQPNTQTGQLQLQILPLFFREFQLDKNTPTVWNYKKQNITLSNEIPFAPQFVAQYEHMFKPSEPSPQQKEPEVVKLFDEDEA